MRKFNVVYMRGGTSKGCIFHKEDLPENRAEWDDIFVQVMGSPDPKQIDGMGGTLAVKKERAPQKAALFHKVQKKWAELTL